MSYQGTQVMQARRLLERGVQGGRWSRSAQHGLELLQQIAAGGRDLELSAECERWAAHLSGLRRAR